MTLGQIHCTQLGLSRCWLLDWQEQYLFQLQTQLVHTCSCGVFAAFVTNHVLPCSWVESGTEISPFYDSLLAKLMVHAPTRKAAVAKMKQALAGEEDRHLLKGRRTCSCLLPLSTTHCKNCWFKRTNRQATTMPRPWA